MKDQLLTELLPLKKDIEAIDPVVSFFHHSIEKELGSNLLAIVLFGSRARGDFKEHSDYDFLLLVENKSSELRDQVIDIEVETLDTFDKLISCLIWDKADWNFKKNFPIGRNILKEGVLV